jgi:hypothetical protein
MHLSCNKYDYDIPKMSTKMGNKREAVTAEFFKFVIDGIRWDDISAEASRQEAALEREDPDKLAADLVDLSSHNPARARIIISDYIYGMWYGHQVAKELDALVRQYKMHS